MLCPSHSLLLVYADKYLYVVYLNKMIYGNKYKKTNVVRLEKFQFLEKGQNRNFDYKIVNSG